MENIKKSKYNIPIKDMFKGAKQEDFEVKQAEIGDSSESGNIKSGDKCFEMRYEFP